MEEEVDNFGDEYGYETVLPPIAGETYEQGLLMTIASMRREKERAELLVKSCPLCRLRNWWQWSAIRRAIMRERNYLEDYSE